MGGDAASGNSGVDVLTHVRACMFIAFRGSIRLTDDNRMP